MMALAFLAAAATLPEIAINGRWKDTERDIVVSISKNRDGFWYGRVLSSPRAEEVGKTLFSKLAFNKESREYVGEMTKPDDDTKAEVTIVLMTNDRMEATARKFVFTKKLTLDRQR